MNLFRLKISNNSDFQIHYKLNKAKYKSTYNVLCCEIKRTNINICFYLFIFKNKIDRNQGVGEYLDGQRQSY